MAGTAVVAHEMSRLLQEKFSQIGVAYRLDAFDSFVKGEIGRVDFLFKFFIRLAEGKDDATLIIVGKPSLSLPDKNTQWYIFFSGTAAGMQPERSACGGGAFEPRPLQQVLRDGQVRILEHSGTDVRRRIRP